MNNELYPFGINIWHEKEENLLNTYSSGLPFLICPRNNVCTGINYGNEGTAKIDCGWEASYLCFLGNVSTFDKGTGSWFCKRGDMSKEQFIGDSLGSMEILYSDGERMLIPLVFGFTVWWDQPLRSNVGHGPYHEPFKSCSSSRKTLDDILYVNEYRQQYENGEYQPGMSFCSIIEVKNKTIHAVIIKRNMELFGEPLFTGMTILSKSALPGLYEFPRPIADVVIKDKKILNEVIICKSFYEERLEALKKTLYTFKEDCSKDFVIEIPEGFKGPKIEFKGSRHAKMLTNIYYANMQDLLDKTDWRNQMTPTSTKKAPAWGEYEWSIGTWKNDLGRGNHDTYAGVWSRDGSRAGVERRKFGFIDFTPTEILSYDRCLYLNTPPHWPRDITNVFNGHSKYDSYTVDGLRVVGVPENDGHGSIMILRYIDWSNCVNRSEWHNRYWKATVDSAEWVCWSMDHKLSDRQPDDVLWSVTEPSGYGGLDIYSNVICLYGLLSCITIAKAHDEQFYHDKWIKYAQRLRNGILKNIVSIKTEGQVWRAHENSSWQDHDESLAPIFTASDLFGFSMDEYPFDNEWMKICINTYKDRIMSEPRYNHARAFGYGYGYLVQAALLLDMEEDYEIVVGNICDHSYFSGLSPWIVPEGVAVHPSGEYWYRSGDHGNTAQQVEILKMIRIMAGIDNTDINKLKVIPRVPKYISEVEIKEFKVRSAQGRISEVGYKLEQNEKGVCFTGDFNTYDSKVKIRLGACPPDKSMNIKSTGAKKDIVILNNGTKCCWFEFASEDRVTSIEIEYV